MPWFALNIIGIIPLDRRMPRGTGDPLEGCSSALSTGAILIFFPEGTRGEPERLAVFKSGIAYLARRHPEVPIVPIFLYGLGKALPRGELLLVPFYADVFVGEPIPWEGERDAFMARLESTMRALAAEGHFPPWE